MKNKFQEALILFSLWTIVMGAFGYAADGFNTMLWVVVGWVSGCMYSWIASTFIIKSELIDPLVDILKDKK